MVSPGMANPSMAMKCITQMPSAPIPTAPSASQRALAAPSENAGPRRAAQAQEGAEAGKQAGGHRGGRTVLEVMDS